MLIAENSQHVILKLRNPNKVLTVIPTAKFIEYRGKKLVAVPHKLDETKVLRNLGFEVPSPVLTYYDWPGAYVPFDVQRSTVDFLVSNDRAFCLNDMGTGKTMSVLWAYDYLRKVGAVKRMLVVSPLSTLERTWGDEIFYNFLHLDHVILYGTRDKRIKLLSEKHDIYIINHDGIRIIRDELASRDDINLIVIDELASFRTVGTERWKCMNVICNRQVQRRVWGLTGTPTPNAPTDAWAQCRLIVPYSTVEYFSRFRDLTMRQVTQYKWVPKDNALDVVSKTMQPAIRFSRNDCVDLPPVIYETRQVELSSTQKALYKDMLTKLKLLYKGGEVVAANEAIKVNKLLQIVCGVVYSNGADDIVVPAQERIDVTKEIIEEAGGKVIVFVPFRGALQHVADKLAEEYDVAVIHGGVKRKDRDSIFKEFQDTGSKLKVLVAQPGTMSHGLTLTAANTIIWFAPVHSNEIFQQAIARISRPGQKLSQLIVMIEGSDIERRVYDKLRKRERLQGTLLSMLKELN